MDSTKTVVLCKEVSNLAELFQEEDASGKEALLFATCKNLTLKADQMKGVSFSLYCKKSQSTIESDLTFTVGDPSVIRVEKYQCSSRGYDLFVRGIKPGKTSLECRALRRNNNLIIEIDVIS
jgi:hypothetical protein